MSKHSPKRRLNGCIFCGGDLARDSHTYMRQTTIFVFALLVSFFSWGDESTDIRRYLQEFHEHPVQAMERLPQKIVNGRSIDRGVINYKQMGRFKYKEQIHDAIRAKSKKNKLYSVPLANDLATAIVDLGKVNTNIESLDNLKLTSAALKQIPWADSYWPIYKGLIGIRYSDPNFPDSKNFLVNYNYISANPADAIVASGDSNTIDQLSPAEKYDLLVGDSNWTLTRYAWDQGKRYLEKENIVPSWVGICHGWSAAAHMNVAVSHRPIVALSTKNIPITFYPSDIKALQSMIWANASPTARFIGTKCKVSKPQKNSIGRVIDPDCLDSNPATFHLILTNQLGINQRSFVMDETYDAEVWNFPVTAYKYKYFNPQTLEPTLNIKRAIIPIESFKVDKFKEFRSAEVRYVVGIIIDTTYVIEIAPNRGSQDASPQKTFRHFYDLELNAKFEIIGGEWYANAHPDFIWTYDTTAVAKSIVDGSVNSTDWGFQDLFPSQWTPYAQTASARGQPILGVIEALLARETP